MHVMTREHREGGFTLLESLFQILIAAAFLHLIVLFLFFKESVHERMAVSSLIEWELFLVDLQHDLADTETLTFNRNGTQFTIIPAGGGRLIEYRSVNGVIVRRKDQQGHVPLLTSVRSAVFTRQDEMLTIDVVLDDGTGRTRRVAVGTAQE
ncbi:hypothetical protein NCCP2716_05910 [Sporosarcina sp. NCCP-2716]|uniref:competence type IV pilus minor pilin ComGF n=1 Tax=Sporosarcina sp. NCCP-2716 TaxID=2943679 RepID=UPI00203C3884|nr:competence type IV pilus minor pilin ComGF [Sporosarcina sp. NCCP-2716]GKV68093.1 hypothetical protein NCCP2716_05910 [Sporosarcina sp. NCCP-2716]